MPLKATLEERMSKAGKPYYVIVIQLTPNLEKLCWLEPAELEIIRLINEPKKG